MHAEEGAGAPEDRPPDDGLGDEGLHAEVREVPGAGRALYSTAALAAGDVIVREAPLVFCRDDASGTAPGLFTPAGESHWLSEYEGLTDEQKSSIDTFECHGFDEWLRKCSPRTPAGAVRLQRVMYTNGHDFEGGAAIFTHITRAQHTCASPNAGYVHDPRTRTSALIADRPILAGEPITITYRILLQYAPMWFRSEYLLHHFGFHCACPRCACATDRVATLEDTALVKRHTDLESLFVSATALDSSQIQMLEDFIGTCMQASCAMNFHAIRSTRLLFEYHVKRMRAGVYSSHYDDNGTHTQHAYGQSTSRNHFMGALRSLEALLRQLPHEVSPVQFLSSFTSFFASSLKAKSPRPAPKAVLEKLWWLLGQWFATGLGKADSHYRHLLGRLGPHGGQFATYEEALAGFTAIEACALCGEAGGLRCRRCKKAVYCSEACQRTAWHEHRAVCGVGAAG